MMQKEFEERTGMQVTPAEYEKIEKLYMSSGNIDKDTFCKEWKKHSESKLLAELWKRVKHEHDLGMQKKEECDKLRSERWELVDFLLERAQKFGDIELLHKAISMVGHAEVIRRKLDADMPLWELDRAYIKENLK